MRKLVCKIILMSLIILPVAVFGGEQEFFENGAEYAYESGSMASSAEGVAKVISIEGEEIVLLIKGISESPEAPPGHRESEFELERTIFFKDGDYFLDIAGEEVKGEFYSEGKTLTFNGMASMEFTKMEAKKKGGLKSTGKK